MTIQTNIQWRITSATGANLRQGVIQPKPGEDYTDLAAVRRVKKAIGWNGTRCKVDNDRYDPIVLRPVGLSEVCTIDFHEFGSAS